MVEADQSASDHYQDFADALNNWWQDARIERDRLPWRTTRDPWSVLVSEVMLSQTQVDRVAPKYLAFIDRFPTARSCAEAKAGDVLQLWSGLGYNRRALALQAAARLVVAEHDGVVPQNLDALLALPGVGPYTARAVLAFAYEDNVAVVDTNIGRVLARAITGTTLRPKVAQTLADSLVTERQSRNWNLAMMDFGSLVCTLRTPHCTTCPIYAAKCCAWRSHEDAEDPATNSAGVSKKQATFAGSDRQGRGRLIRAACDGVIAAQAIPVVAGWPEDLLRAMRVAADLVREGLLVEDKDHGLQLP